MLSDEGEIFICNSLLYVSCLASVLGVLSVTHKFLLHSWQRTNFKWPELCFNPIKGCAYAMQLSQRQLTFPSLFQYEFFFFFFCICRSFPFCYYCTYASCFKYLFLIHSLFLILSHISYNMLQLEQMESPFKWHVTSSSVIYFPESFLQPQWIKSSFTIPALIIGILCSNLKNVSVLSDSQ